METLYLCRHVSIDIFESYQLCIYLKITFKGQKAKERKYLNYQILNIKKKMSDEYYLY